MVIGVVLSGQGEYRADMAEEWLRGFKELGVPHTEPSLISTLGDKVKIRSWQVGLFTSTKPCYAHVMPMFRFVKHVCVLKKELLLKNDVTRFFVSLIYYQLQN